MSRPSDKLTPINVVPHFSRLHEWIALEEGYFQDEGLEPNMFTDVVHSVSSHHGDEYGKRPQEFVITFWVSPTIAQDTLGKFFRALRLADEALEQDTDRYLHLWERNIPPAFEGDHDYASFGRGEKLIFEPYSLEMFEDAMQFARAWGLHEQVRESDYDRLVAPLST
jgi:hypothetical protein